MKNVTADFDKHAASYEDDLRRSMPEAFAEDLFFVEYKIRDVARRISSKNVNMFLDYGCGIGRSLAFVNYYFPKAEVWGYDVSVECIALARRRRERATLTSNFEELSSGSFEVILLANVLHHVPLPERVRVLTLCRNLLRRDGRIFMFEHNPLNPVTRWVFERCAFDKDAHMLRRREALFLAEKAGLRTVRSGYTLFFPRPLRFLRPIEPMLSWFPLGAQYCVEMGLRT